MRCCCHIRFCFGAWLFCRCRVHSYVTEQSRVLLFQVMSRREKRNHDDSMVSLHLNLLARFVFGLKDQIGFFVNEINPLREGVAVMGRLKSTVSQLVSQVTAVVRENGVIQDELHDLKSRLMQVEDTLVEPDSVPTGQDRKSVV